MFESGDRFLVGLAGAAYAGYLSARLTLHIGGMIVTGMLVSEKVYLAGIADRLAQEGTAGTAQTAYVLQESLDMGGPPVASDDELANVPVLFLQDAVAYVGAQPGLDLGWWRARVDAVVGWGWEQPVELVIVTDDATDD